MSTARRETGFLALFFGVLLWAVALSSGAMSFLLLLRTWNAAPSLTDPAALLSSFPLPTLVLATALGVCSCAASLLWIVGWLTTRKGA